MLFRVRLATTAVAFGFLVTGFAPEKAHAFGAARWTGRQIRKILPPYHHDNGGTGNTGGSGLSCNSVGDGVFSACYYDDLNLSSLKIVRTEAAVDFNWGAGSPDPAIAADTFSARFSGGFNFDAASYRFSVTGDDGVRLYIDDQLVVDQWTDHGPTTYTADKNLSAGRHKIVLQYYEDLGAALVRLSWAKTPAGPSGGPYTMDQIPNEQATVALVDAENPGLMRSDCGEFQKRVMDRLRAKDGNWGYCNMPTLTPADRFMYGPHSAMVDAIVSSCSSNASVGWRPEANDPTCVWGDTNAHPVGGGSGTGSSGGSGSGGSGSGQPGAGPPNEFGFVKSISDSNPGLINDCVGRPIANNFLNEVIRRLQQRDPRWGYFKKPDGRIPRDILAYAWGSETEGTHNTFVIDFVASGCGNTPSDPGFADPASNASVAWQITNPDGLATNGVWSASP